MTIIKENISMIEDTGNPEEDLINTTIEDKEITSLQELIHELQRLSNEYPNAVVSEIIGLAIDTDPESNKEVMVNFRT